MPVAICNGVTEIECPNDIEATILGDISDFEISGWTDSTSSLGAALSRPKSPQYLSMVGAPASRPRRAAPMLDEWVKTWASDRLASP